MKALLNVNNSDSLSKALLNLKAIEGFSGSIVVDQVSSENVIKGVVFKDSIFGKILKNKTEIVIVSHDVIAFDDLLEQARQEFHMNGTGPYKRGSTTELRSIVSFYLEETGLWVILTRCIPKSKAAYYEIELTAHTDD